MAEKKTINRRKFVKTSMLLASALPVFGSALAKGSEKPLVSFGMITDSHYADRPRHNERYYRDSMAKMKECVRVLNSVKPDFAVHLGDFKDQDAKPSERRTMKYLRDFERAYADFDGDRFHVLGNHDMDSLSKEQFLANVTNSGIGKDRAHYSFMRKGVRFIVLDGCYTKAGVSYDHDNFKWDDSQIPESQLEWLKAELSADRAPTVVFIHQQLLGEKTHMVLNADKVRKILSDSGQVLAVFQGHAHVDTQHTENGIHYCTLPAMCDGKGLDNNAFGVATLYDNGDIRLNGYKKVNDRNLKKAKGTS
ncbi:alkaline phosphatase (plasmid) [Fulvitalea axinellae]|uniref:Alkaline phosphatase n=1 Tax=Fulvitalea axinellae TaxID=1182444 RepID=A0AAU9CXJ1_9BACT|nr:alkaline phosphatase [Fulvitalea axinellae]